MRTVKREGGFETLLFGPDNSKSTKSIRKNSVVPNPQNPQPLPTHDSNDTTSSSGGQGTWNHVGESPVAVDTGYNVIGVHDADVVSVQDIGNTGHEVNLSGLTGMRSSVDSLSEYAEDSVMVSSEGSDAYASSASLSQYEITDTQDADVDVDYAAILSSEEEHDYLHPGLGPFSGTRRAVRFSENVEDNWEEICVDVTPFTTLTMPPHIEVEDEQLAVDDVRAVEDTVISRPDTLTQSRQESFMMRQSDYAEVQRKAAIAEKAAADKAAALSASTAAAELVFCEAMSTTLSSGDSPLETESEKVSLRAHFMTTHMYTFCTSIPSDKILRLMEIKGKMHTKSMCIFARIYMYECTVKSQSSRFASKTFYLFTSDLYFYFLSSMFNRYPLHCKGDQSNVGR